jgi:hypothetical protein
MDTWVLDPSDVPVLTPPDQRQELMSLRSNAIRLGAIAHRDLTNCLHGIKNRRVAVKQAIVPMEALVDARFIPNDATHKARELVLRGLREVTGAVALRDDRADGGAMGIRLDKGSLGGVPVHILEETDVLIDRGRAVLQINWGVCHADHARAAIGKLSSADIDTRESLALWPSDVPTRQQLAQLVRLHAVVVGRRAGKPLKRSLGL